MATRREFLVEKGLAKPTRGRFSAEAKAALAEAEAAGVVFDDTPSTEGAQASTDASEQPGPRSGAGRSVSRSRNSSDGSTSGVSVQIVGRNQRPAIRDFSQIVGKTSEGYPVAFATCHRCLSQVSMCRCRAGILPPSYVDTVDSSLLVPIG